MFSLVTFFAPKKVTRAPARKRRQALPAHHHAPKTKAFWWAGQGTMPAKSLLAAKTLGSRVRGNDRKGKFPSADKSKKMPAHQAPAKHLVMHQSSPIAPRN
jgi:hypothetical protein